MSRWHRENPDYQETGMQPPDPRDAWDMERKRQKEEGPITDDDREMCKACGEFPAIYKLMYCRRCASGIEEDRLERESGR